jgi:hypothetical protein
MLAHSDTQTELRYQHFKASSLPTTSAEVAQPARGGTSRLNKAGIEALLFHANNLDRRTERVGARSKDDLFAPASDRMECRSSGIDSSIKASRSHGERQVPRPHGQDIRPLLSRTCFAYAIMFVMLLALIRKSPLVSSSGVSRIGVAAGALPVEHSAAGARFAERDDTSADTCTRWSQQSAIVNGTLYIYGGRAKQVPSQTSDTWNNDFLTLDVTKSWDVASPLLKGLPKPSGPPPVANGYIWRSYESLFLYGGEFSDNPLTSPVPYSLWEYNIKASKWNEHDSPKTSAGNGTDGEDEAVQRAAEGAGISVPALGRGWYFGGHLDSYTTPGWTQPVPRVYLKSMIEYTFPGSQNPAIDSLGMDKAAGEDGVWRNVTQGGLQNSNGFTERADGVLVYVPGFGAEGIILGLAGGTNQSFTQMNVIDVFDVANSTWYKQSTRGGPPDIRVNPCAVAASAPDGSSTNIYLYGGQNLIPYDEQTQYDDMWILTVPSFTWIKVDAADGSPNARAGHSCEVR